MNLYTLGVVRFTYVHLSNCIKVHYANAPIVKVCTNYNLVCTQDASFFRYISKEL